MKKPLSLIVVVVIVLSGLGAVASSENNHVKNNSRTSGVADTTPPDELDQSMTSVQGVLPVGASTIFGGIQMNLTIAQSFIPQKEILTRVQFYLARNSTTTYPCTVAVRDNLTKGDLASISLNPDQFPVYNPEDPYNLSWMTFDFNDIWVTIGHTYYLVVYTVNITDNFYIIAGNGTNVYLNGTVFLSLDNGITWSEFPEPGADGCFKTYGRSNSPPTQPSNPTPANGATGVDRNADLNWSACTDPDPGDTVTYDVYFGTTTSPGKVASNQTGISYSLQPLEYNTTYYWRIIAWDHHNASNASALWSFKTKADTTPPTVTIAKPIVAYIYLNDKQLMKRILFPTTLIIKGITIEANSSDTETGVDRVEFFIDGIAKANDTSAPYSWLWSESSLFKLCTIKVVSYDKAGNSKSVELTVRKLF